MKNIYKNICKNIHYFILILLIILTCIMLFVKYNINVKESFIGKNKSETLSDLGDEIKIEKKEYEIFPPLKNKSKYDVINDIFGKQIPTTMPQIQDAGKQELEKSDLQKTFSSINENNPLLGNCDFYFNKCPNNKNSMATIKGNNLSCNKNGSETTQAEAIAEIKNGHISKIAITNKGSGYNYQNPPIIKIITNGKGNGASAKANVDKNGFISNIDIIDYGYGYIETPKIEIEPPQMDGVCHLCC